MNPLWFVPAILSVFGGVQDYEAGKEMQSLAREQELMAEENAALEQRELDENVRRQKNRDAQVRGSAAAKAAASGQRVEGTLSDYLSFIESEQGRELDWMESAGASRIRLNKQAAMNQARSLRINADAKKNGLYTGFLQGLSYLGQGGLFSSAPGVGANAKVRSSGTKYSGGGGVGASASIGTK